MTISSKYRALAAAVAATAAVGLVWGLCESGAEDRTALVDDVPELWFSRESGFYDEEFDLEIVSNGGTVYYTTDGSFPTKSSTRYTGPIHIADATANENVYSLRTDLSTAFAKEFTVPDYKVDKCTVIRAAIYYPSGGRSQAKTASYFVGFGEKGGYENMNVVSIVADPANLFDYDKGIYVTGRPYDDYLEQIARGELEEDQRWAIWPANYRKRGIRWERPADIQFFDTNGDLLLSQRCGIRIRGQWSRADLPKSLNLYAREIYDGSSVFRYPFFNALSDDAADGPEYFPSRMTLTNGGNDYSRCKDWLIHTLCRDMDFATMSTVPCVMFLDGEYWGVYWLTEKYDEPYVNYRYGIDRDNIAMIKSRKLENGTEEDFLEYSETKELLSSMDMTDEANYRKACELLDMDNTVDYYAAMLYIARTKDWPDYNYMIFRSRYPDTDSFSDCRYRWMLYDVNSPGITTGYANLDTIQAAMERDTVFANLMNNDGFRNRLLDRIVELDSTVFSKENVSRRLDEFHALMDIPMKYHCDRFYGGAYKERYVDLVDSIEAFFELRRTAIHEMTERYRSR